ncbi:Bug family tripartite tricarboxylate transporter substrate binding protein [Roseomonas sp. CCTCC AB2023176]|uniref:Bug family tripartite tricarboxylate transporter substrate binding protein n=1 Tax=Roseomonas sp. CCTCC AB2023176 TaxID=3342640 RepID=UPI0035DB9C0C
MPTRRHVLTATLAAPSVVGAARAQGTGGPIRLVIPFATGGSTDVIGRMVADEMSRRLGQPVVPENRPGAGATLGTGLVARAAPDGTTLLLSTISGLAIGHTLYRDRIQWDADRDFAHVAMLFGTPYVLAVNPAFPARTLEELVAESRRRPGGLDYATSGIGSVPHLLGLRLAQATGANLTHVPYRGGSQAATDVVAGVVPALLDGLAATAPLMKAASVRPLAMSSAERVPEFPEVPTFAESGVPGATADGWAGIAAPAGTPRPVLERLAEAVRGALQTPAIQRRLAETATGPGDRFLDDMQAYVRAEVAAWAPVVAQSGARPE